MDDRIAIPSRVVLATDLSHRCDRALDRAVQLAGQWQAPLLAITVLESADNAPASDAKEWAQRQEAVEAHTLATHTLRSDLEGSGLEPTIRVGQGDPADFVLSQLTAGDLVVTGIARSRFLDVITLGSTTERLVRRAAAPVLVVRHRTRRAYRHITVACDFSPTAARALQTALIAFPDATCTLFHAASPPLGGLVDSDQSRLDFIRNAGDEARAFLATLALSDADRERLRIQIEYGAVEACLRDFVRDHGVDLVVVGSHGRSALFDILIGSTAKRVLETVDADVLMVAEPRARS